MLRKTRPSRNLGPHPTFSHPVKRESGHEHNCDRASFGMRLYFVNPFLHLVPIRPFRERDWCRDQGFCLLSKEAQNVKRFFPNCT